VTPRRLELKPVYTVAELAAAIGVSTKALTRWLRKEKVRLHPRKPTRRTPLRVHFNSLLKWSEWSDLWESCRIVERLRKSGW